MEQRALSDIARKKRVFAHAKKIGNIAKTCRYFGISRETYYKWKRSFSEKGDIGLVNSKPCPENPTLRVPQSIEEKILHLRKNYHFGPERISWSLERYFNMKVSTSGVYQVLKRHGLNKLPRGTPKRSIKDFKRYEKQVPGHRIQVDVKFLTFYKNGEKIRRFQYTAIDDATRARALQVYDRHTQENAIKFIVTTRLLPRQLWLDASDDFGGSPKVCKEEVPLLP